MHGRNSPIDPDAELRNPWRAPEHSPMSKGMKRNRDAQKGPVGHLIVDKRPTILLPQRPTYSDSVQI